MLLCFFLYLQFCSPIYQRGHVYSRVPLFFVFSEGLFYYVFLYALLDLSVFDFEGIENFELMSGVSVDQLKISLISALKGPNGFLDPGQRIRENRFDMFFLKFSFVSIFFIRIAKGVRLFLFEYKVSYSGVINLKTGFAKLHFASW